MQKHARHPHPVSSPGMVHDRLKKLWMRLKSKLKKDPKKRVIIT
jgi:hypothetical protein